MSSENRQVSCSARLTRFDASCGRAAHAAAARSARVATTTLLPITPVCLPPGGAFDHARKGLLSSWCSIEPRWTRVGGHDAPMRSRR